MTTINDLVLPVDNPVVIRQGFNSLFSHKVIEDEGGSRVDDSYSLDFVVDEGNAVYATRAGTVRQLDVSSNVHYFPKQGEKINPDLARYAAEHANYIIIEHDDGTCGLYIHLQQAGSFVEQGQRVQQGQKIGLSGNTGFSSEQHLHFSVFRQHSEGFRRKTVAFSFKDYDGKLEDREINPQLY